MLPRECFLEQEGKKQVEAESNEYFKIKEIKAENGVFVYLENALFPLKSFPSSGNLFAMNSVKALFVETLKIISRWYFFLPLLVIGLSSKKLQKVIDSFNRVSWKIISPYLLKDRYLLPATKSLHFLIFTFLNKLGVHEETCDRFATILVHLIENDNAYRLRVADLFSEIKDLKPKELRRLAKVLKSREPNLDVQIPTIIKILSFAVYLPKVRRALEYAVTNTDIKSIGLDESDKYWTCIRTDYKFMGMSDSERLEFAKLNGWTYPQKIV
jgi:hypothetical protein